MFKGQNALLFILSILLSNLGQAKLDSITQAKIDELIGARYRYVLDQHTDDPDTRQFLEFMLQQEAQVTPLERDDSTEYKELRQGYLARSIQMHIGLKQSVLIGRVPAAFDSGHQLKHQSPPQYLGLIVFKKDEMQQRCQRVVDRAKKIGAHGIAFYYPVHYSGGNSAQYKMPPNPVYNKHYRYEYAQLPIQKHVDDCLDLIVKNKLKLSYVPHLESIALIENAAIDEWRMYSGIPLDEHYYQAAFGPLIKYLSKRSKHKFNVNNLALTLAAEIDTMVITRPDDALKVVANLEKDLSRYHLKGVPIYFNTNGDFYHAWDLPQVPKQVACQNLKSLFRKIDYFAPSMYGDKQHFVIEKNRVQLDKTIDRYYTSFENKLKELCPKEKIPIRKIPIGFGEFALDLKDDRQKYSDVLDRPKKIKFVQYWSHSKWDHIGVLADYQMNSELLFLPQQETPKERRPSSENR
jgi:hypothetical protein